MKIREEIFITRIAASSFYDIVRRLLFLPSDMDRIAAL